jgi:hypothetical protein
MRNSWGCPSRPPSRGHAHEVICDGVYIVEINKSEAMREYVCEYRRDLELCE